MQNRRGDDRGAQLRRQEARGDHRQHHGKARPRRPVAQRKTKRHGGGEQQKPG